ncbi:hypothetical protein CSPX01_00198 [Colletotrichum filicis]|nr:hypothetical protein CSPX01_00198 [Colletotrichum filicis]
MSLPKTPVRARIRKFWIPSEHASLDDTAGNHMMLDEGIAGIVRNPAKKTKNRYLEFEVYDREETRWGLYDNPKRFKDPAIVSEDFLEIVTLPASGSLTEVNKPTPVAKADESIEMPFESLLVTFFESCKIRNDDLDLAGVSLRQLDMLKQPKKITSIAGKMVQGLEKMGTLDLFRDGMLSLKEIISRATEVDRLPAEEKNKLDNEHVLYITVYHGKDDSSSENPRTHCFWKMSTKGTEYVNSQRQKIESTVPSPYSVNHYEYMKGFLKKHKGKWAIYPIAKTEKPDPSEDSSCHAWAEQAMIAPYDAYHPGMRDMSWEGFNNPVTYLSGQVTSIFTTIAASVTKSEAFSSLARPGFKASPGPESGLNWNSRVLELCRVANGLWTGQERIRHEDGPSCWLYKGPPCRVEDNGNVKDLDRLAVTFCTRPMPEGVRGTKETIQRLCLPSRKNDGGEWKVKDGDYVVPAIEIAILSTGNRHPCAYEKFTGVGLFDNFKEVFRVACRIENTNADGNLETRYLTQESAVSLPDLSKIHGTKEQRDAMDGSWAQATSILATFVKK